MPEIPKVLITTGEPAGVGPDIVLAAACLAHEAHLIATGDRALLAGRAAALGLEVTLVPYSSTDTATVHKPGVLPLIDVPLQSPCIAGALDRGDLEHASDFGQRIEICVGVFNDPEALVRNSRDDALLNEVEHRLAHRSRRDPELFGERGNGIGNSRLQLTGDEGGAQRRGDLFTQRHPPADLGQSDRHSKNPAGKGSVGSRKYWAVPVTQARPVIVGTTASTSPTRARSTKRPVKVVPMNDSFTKSVSSGNSPRACSWAMRADVPVPQGDRSNQPG